MLSARHRQAADADTRKTGDGRILITKSTKRGMPESAGPEAVVLEQTLGGAMYQWQSAVAKNGKIFEMVLKRLKSLKLLARISGYLRILALICGLGRKSPSGLAPASRVTGGGGCSAYNVSGNTA